MAGIRNNPIQTGYIPVEYNMYIELTEKAEKYDRMMGALKAYHETHKRYPRVRKMLSPNQAIFDIERDCYFSKNEDREYIVCFLKSIERFANDFMCAKREDVTMSEIIRESIIPKYLWEHMIKDESILSKVFKYGDSNYISFGFDRENISKFIDKRTDFLFMDFNCVNKEDTK